MKLESACMEIARSEGFQTFMKKNGFAPMVRGSTDFAAFLRAQDEQWHKVIVGANVGDTSISGSAAVSHDPGPWVLPTGVAVLVGLGVCYQFARRKQRARAETGSNRLLAGALLTFVLYLLALPYIGFFSMTALISILAIRWLGKGWGSAIVSTLILMVAVYLLFVRLFRVPLPAGVLF